MEKLILKINHFLFKWYYKRTPLLFREFTILKSISLLIQKYEQDQIISDKIRKEREQHLDLSSWDVSGVDDFFVFVR